MPRTLTLGVFLAGALCLAVLLQAGFARSLPEDTRPRRTDKGDPYIDRWADKKMNSTVGRRGVTVAAVGFGLCLLAAIALLATGSWTLA